MEKILLIGAGGHAKSVIDSIRSNSEYEIVGIIDKDVMVNKEIIGVPVIGKDEDLPMYYKKGIKNAFITIGSVGDTTVRQRLYEYTKSIGFQHPNIIDATDVALKSNIIGGVDCKECNS